MEGWKIKKIHLRSREVQAGGWCEARKRGAFVPQGQKMAGEEKGQRRLEETPDMLSPSAALEPSARPDPPKVGPSERGWASRERGNE